HIECSAMADRWLWTDARSRLSERGLAHPHQFDIHGGGIDLVFPHHENEIAQTRCAFRTPAMANFWMHNGFLQVEGRKMAKSEGNFITIRELLDDGWPGEVLRYNMLRTHYRQPIDWTLHGLSESMKTLDRWYLLGTQLPEHDWEQQYLDQEFMEALADDLNTPRSLARLHSIYGEIKGPASGLHQIELRRKFKLTAGFIGLLRFDSKDWLTRAHSAPKLDTARVE